MSNTPNQIHFITAPSERITILDSLRGFAVFGILAVNITAFALPNHDLNLMNMNAVTWYDNVALWFNNLLTEGKFYVLFSFLFGVGFSVQFASIQKKGGNLWSFYPRRLAILFGLGLLHSLLWWGDVLRLYALLGFGLLLCQDLSVRSLLVLAVAFLGLSGVLSFFPNLTGNIKSPTSDDVLLSLLFALVHMAPTAFALFLLGRVAGKMGFFANLPQYRHRLKPIIAWAFGVWAVLNLGVYALGGMNNPVATLPKTLSDIAMTTMYVAMLCLIYLNHRTKHLLNPLTNVGRMALTNYVAQTLICVAFFKGFNLEGKVGAGWLLLMTFVIYGMQAVLSTWWLGRFRYGVLEWLWRSMTFGKLQPLAK